MRSVYYFPDEELQDIKQRLWDGEPAPRIARMHSVPARVIYSIKVGDRGASIPWPDGSFGPMPIGQCSEVAKGKNYRGVGKSAQETYETILAGREASRVHRSEQASQGDSSEGSYTQLSEELQEPKNALEAIEVLNAVAKRYRDAGEAIPEAVKASNGLKVAWIQAPDSEKERELIKRASDILSELK